MTKSDFCGRMSDMNNNNSDGGEGSGRYPKGSSDKDKSASGYGKSDYENAVIGMKTGDNVEIKKCSEHAFKRVIERDIWPESVTNALKVKSIPAEGGKVAHIHKGTHVYVDNKSGTVVTSIYKGGKRK